MDQRMAKAQTLDFQRMLRELTAQSSHNDALMVRNHPLAQTPELQKRLGPMEHRAFAREFAQESPLSAAVTLPFMIPGYTAAKKLGLHGGRSPAGLDEMAEGYKGMWEGLGSAGRQAGKSILEKLQSFGKNTGEYWAGDNQTFEKTNPGIGQRVLRSINPATGLGSALGSMHTAAGNGDPAGMALATAEAVPLFGTLKTIATAGKGITKSSSKQIADWKKFTALLGISAGTGLASDAYANQQENM